MVREYIEEFKQESKSRMPKSEIENEMGTSQERYHTEGKKEGGKLKETVWQEEEKKEEELWEDKNRWKGNPHTVEKSHEKEE